MKELIEKINASDDKAEIYLALQGKDASDEDDIYNRRNMFKYFWRTYFREGAYQNEQRIFRKQN